MTGPTAILERIQAEHLMASFALVLSHPAGFGIELFGGIGQLAELRIDRAEDGSFFVRHKIDSVDQLVEEHFDDIREAVAYFLDLRDQFKIGADYETKAVPT